MSRKISGWQLFILSGCYHQDLAVYPETIERTTLIPEQAGKQPLYLTLLQVWFTLPPMLPLERWAFTPPFHLYPGLKKPGKFIFCGTSSKHKITLIFPGGYPAPCSMKFGLSSSPIFLEKQLPGLIYFLFF